MELMILKHDAKYNRNKDIANKIAEESEELQQALNSECSYRIVDEALDLITVCLNAIYQQRHLTPIEQSVKEHQEKLLKREWKADKIIEFTIRDAFYER